MEHVPYQLGLCLGHIDQRTNKQMLKLYILEDQLATCFACDLLVKTAWMTSLVPVPHSLIDLGMRLHLHITSYSHQHMWSNPACPLKGVFRGKTNLQKW